MQVGWRQEYSGPSRFSRERRRALEHLDQASPAERIEMERSYRDLETISRLPGQFRPLKRAVERLLAESGWSGAQGRRLEILELGAGTGAVGLRLARGLAKKGHKVDLLSTDLRPDFLPRAREGSGVLLKTQKLDALRDPLPQADIIVANLLVHHFETKDAASVLSRMESAGRLGGVVFDLDRNLFAFTLLRFFFPLWARSPMTVADALLSVQQAFRADEILRLALEAGIKRPRIKRHLWIRNLLWWRRSG
jgi:SAM-dependent methyltransferase